MASNHQWRCRRILPAARCEDATNPVDRHLVAFLFANLDESAANIPIGVAEGQPVQTTPRCRAEGRERVEGGPETISIDRKNHASHRRETGRPLRQLDRRVDPPVNSPSPQRPATAAPPIRRRPHASPIETAEQRRAMSNGPAFCGAGTARSIGSMTPSMSSAAKEQGARLLPQWPSSTAIPRRARDEGVESAEKGRAHDPHSTMRARRSKARSSIFSSTRRAS